MSEPVLVIEGLDVHYDRVQALNAINMTVQSGQITTMIGSNGAGKTTLLKAVVGMLSNVQGSVSFAGEDIAGLEVDEIVARGISLVPEGRRLFTTMTVLENLEIGAYRRTDASEIKRDMERVLTYFPILHQRLRQTAGSLSGGQQQMLAVGRALMSGPRLLMLDEPSVGLAPNIVQTIEKIIRTIHADGVDVLLVEQNANLALDISEYGYVLENGSIAMSGSSAELAGSDLVREAYLGM